MTDEEIIIDTIEKIRPFLMSDGGDVSFVKYENNIVYVKLMGACQNCSLVDYTIKDSIEYAIKEMLPTVKEVINVTEDEAN